MHHAAMHIVCSQGIAARMRTIVAHYHYYVKSGKHALTTGRSKESLLPGRAGRDFRHPAVGALAWVGVPLARFAIFFWKG